MNKIRELELNPNLIVGKETTIDHMGRIVSAAVEQKRPTFKQQVMLLRSYARKLCPVYMNCRRENWCWLCNSGERGIYNRGALCLDCKLLANDARLRYQKTLVQISQTANNHTDQSVPMNEISNNITESSEWPRERTTLD